MALRWDYSAGTEIQCFRIIIRIPLLKKKEKQEEKHGTICGKLARFFSLHENPGFTWNYKGKNVWETF
jgi:hypothetical protein